MKKQWLISAVILAMSASLAHAVTPSFQGLGDFPGGEFFSGAFGISADGSTVVGSSESFSSYRDAFFWTAQTGMVSLGNLPSGVRAGWARAVSADGSVIVGGQTAKGENGWRWTSGSGFLLLGSDCRAKGVSADGSVIVGAVFDKAARWTQASGWETLGSTHQYLNAVSGDGSVIVGTKNGTPTEALRWTEQTGLVGLGHLPSGDKYGSVAEGISADGTVVVGGSDDGDGWSAFRWTSAEGMVALDCVPGWSGANHRAYDASADGSRIVGYAATWGAYTYEAILWQAGSGPHRLKEFLVDECGLDLTGWSLEYARGISDDGMTIVGYGHNPAGDDEAWIATIPEPATLALLAAGLAGLLVRKRRT